MAMITLKEYALRHGRNPTVLRQKAIRNGFKTATKMGRDWIIDEEEPLIDNRVRSGKYTGWREKYGKTDQPQESPTKE